MLFKNIIVINMFIMLSFSACTSHQDNGYYKRANKASEKALNKLDKE